MHHLSTLDFDGDKKRDLAVWVPPLDAGTPGTFRVLTSRSGFNSELTMSFGDLGDTPVVADYNGDGFADFAVLHDVGVIGDGAAQKQWRICASSVVQPVPPPPALPTVTHSCASPLQEVWGDRSDVPYPGTRFSSSSTGELTVYRKSNKTM